MVPVSAVLRPCKRSWKSQSCVTHLVRSVLLGSGRLQKGVWLSPRTVGMTVAWLSHLEPPELLTGSPVEGQGIAPVLAELGHHMQTLVLELVIECLDAEVLQGPGREQPPCERGLGGRLWDEQGPGLE